MMIRDYYEQLYAKNTDNREKMDRFLEKLNLPRQPGRNRSYEQANYKQNCESKL